MLIPLETLTCKGKCPLKSLAFHKTVDGKSLASANLRLLKFYSHL